uniref:BTB domain-containing protein n=1 Tax=Parascaris univalens TaxID=6257 RepID=A0A915BV09_PARUN
MGHFHRPGDICRERLFKELDFWKINRGFFAPCCMSLSMEEEGSGEEIQKGSYQSVEYADQFDGVCCSNSRRQLWLVMEDPSSGTTAKGFAIVSISMVIASVTGMILGSLPELQTSSLNITSGGSEDLNFKPHLLLDYVELVCIIWFTIEYLARFTVCTEKYKFIREPLNLIDSLTIIPFYLEILLNVAGLGANTIGEFRGLAMIMRVVRVMRVARVFKLARYSSGLKSFGMTVKTSLPELSMLTLFLLTAIIFFSTLMYFAERDEPGTKFKSIPHAGWWCIVTMTTVGYGDFCPQTFFGKIIASCASISGVLVLAFPITMIVENFSKNYDTEKNDFKNLQRRRRLARAYV